MNRLMQKSISYISAEPGDKKFHIWLCVYLCKRQVQVAINFADLCILRVVQHYNTIIPL